MAIVMLNYLLAILNSRQGMREIFLAYDSVRVQPTDVSRPVVLQDSLSTQSIYSQTWTEVSSLTKLLHSSLMINRVKKCESGREESAPRPTLFQMSQVEQAV